ncbi:hypothetical protein LPJ53_003945 [Coemansia erecta]|uniref:RRM domain-containing protein n=1 Tax=Coemansia erecta TaxID=147472 RepID=A0A9W8CS76_9FUNG|nr:hypothetical protein LPJ53_003945 [Coemansia erecta]
MSQSTPMRNTGRSIAQLMRQSHAHVKDQGDAAVEIVLPTLPKNGLSATQQEGLDKALAYIEELQQTVFKDIVEAEKKRREEEGKIPEGTVNPGLLAGMDSRALSIMSRLYVGSINFELTDEHINQVFSEFGPVRSVSMSKDPASGRHKGYGFVEFEVPEAAALALEAMNGTVLGGRALKIGRPNNYETSVAQGFPQPPKERIYVANVNQAISEDVLKEIFEPFGAVSACVLAPDIATRQHRGWGYIEFAEAAAAEQAVVAMNQFMLGNLVLRVRGCVVGGPLGQGMAGLPVEPSPASASQAAPKPPQQVMDVVASINLSIDAAAPQPQPPVDQHNVDNQTFPAITGSPIVLLENVVGGRSEVDDDLAGDMADEAAKCGKITKVVVHLASEHEMQQRLFSGQVGIFLQYSDPDGALRALELFNGRWFGGRQIAARPYDPDQYRMLTSADTMVFIP